MLIADIISTPIEIGSQYDHPEKGLVDIIKVKKVGKVYLIIGEVIGEDNENLNS